MPRIPLFSTKFKKDFSRIERQGKNTAKLKAVIELLLNDTPLPAKHKDHGLTGGWNGCRDCHIEPDWLLIYEAVGTDELLLHRTGTHAELFGK